jgi:hypothetical protein
MRDKMIELVNITDRVRDELSEAQPDHISYETTTTQ